MIVESILDVSLLCLMHSLWFIGSLLVESKKLDVHQKKARVLVLSVVVWALQPEPVGLRSYTQTIRWFDSHIGNSFLFVIYINEYIGNLQ